MSTDTPPKELPRAVVRKRRGIPTVWVIPIIAALVGGWLWFRAVQDVGPKIEISFETAEGLEAGKTLLKYKSLEVGRVLGIRLDTDLERVLVTAELIPGSEGYLRDNTQFWVVKPRIGATGISGLSTILSGAYVGVDFAKSGVRTTSFIGLETPPRRSADAEGLRIKLRSRSLGSISVGTVVSHLQIKMGDVEGYTYLRDEELIEFDLYIEPQYADLVRKNSRFWNATGFTANLTSNGFELHTESLAALLVGGIAFDSAIGEAPGPPSVDGDTFWLNPTAEEAGDYSSEPQRDVAYFDEPVNGLTVGSPVVFLGIEIGRVVEIGIEIAPESTEFLIRVVLETYRHRLNLKFDPNSMGETERERMQTAIDRGLRAQLGPTSLLTGTRDIILDFYPDSPTVLAHGNSELLEIPTIRSTGQALGDMLDQLPVIVSDLQKSVGGIAALVETPKTGETLDSLHSASTSLAEVMSKLDSDSGPLMGTLTDLRTLVADLESLVSEVRAETPEILSSLQETIDAAYGMASNGQAGVGSLAASLPVLEHELSTALREIAAGMRSIAALADYLERHPEALLKGKSDSGDF